MRPSNLESTRGNGLGVAGFFRFHGVWAPGVRLFRSLRFRAKAALISISLLLPALIMGSAYLAGVQEQIDFTAKEREGVAAMQLFVPVLHGLINVRNATRAGLGGYDTAKDYAAGRAAVDKALEALTAQVRERGDPLALAEPLAAMQAAWAATASAKNGADDKGRTVFGPVVEASLKVLQGMSDRSNLVLDPDVESLYLINGLFLTMPKAAEDLGQLWGWGTFAVARGGLENPEQHRRFAVWSARAAGGIDDTRAFFDRAFLANPALKTRVDLKGFDVALKFQQSSDPTELIKAAMEPNEVFDAGRKAVDGYFTVFDATLPALDELLSVRAQGLTSQRNLKAAAAVGFVLLGMYLFLSFSKVMDGGLREMELHLRWMAEGDLRHSPQPWGSDEAADLMRQLALTQQSIRQIVQDVRGASHSISDASFEIAAGSNDLSSRTEETASQLQNTAASLEEITTTLGQTTANTQHAATLAAENAGAAERSGHIIVQAVSTMAEVNAASKRVGDIVGVIDGIAFQTNILALNAAVEAARAGEQGRGFAVVASEVRSLAQRSAAAAREIKTLIHETVQKIEGGSAVVGQAGQQVQGLVGSVQAISRLLGEISSAAGQQNAGLSQVGSAVDHLDRMTQQNSALVEETAAASEALRRRAEELVGTVARFQVEAENADPQAVAG